MPAKPASSQAPPGPEKVEELLGLDPMQVELGYGLLALADQAVNL